MSRAVIAGVGMSRFGKHMDEGLKALGREAVEAAIGNAGVPKKAIEAAWVGNAMAGLITGQECIRGQVVLRSAGIGGIPVVNVENACASASTAFQQACAMVQAGLYDVVLAVGVEKLYHADKKRSFAAIGSAVDTEELAQIVEGLKKSAAAQGATQASEGAGEKRSMFMDFYAATARRHMRKYGTTARQFAAVAAKNSFHGSLNPKAQFQNELTVDQVLAEPMIAEPLTRAMCSPIGDGSAAAVIVSERKARELGIARPVYVAATVLRSGWDHGDEEEDTVRRCVREAYERAGVGPKDLSVIECHDASAPAELIYYEELGLCGEGEGGKLVDSGATKLGGRIPVNPSGGLLRKGHPVGATGLAQVTELVEQLRGEAGRRQVPNARVALAQNGGGQIANDAAAMCVSILTV
ncbi:MAG TPA: thiolase family protein [Myxococcota bacterium]|jgi:acetyl-CoA acetyltransferase|nr:thiolase family protein [Myxococcota bacterium]